MGYEWLGPLLQAAGGATGEALSQGDKAKQTQLLADLLAKISAQQVPDLSPISAEMQQDSALSGYRPDASLLGTQRDTLARLQNIDKGGGYSIEDKADLARIGNQVAEQQRTAGSALHAAMARRGALGSGEDYASQMGLAQNANQQAYQGGLDQKKIALQRRLSAMGQEASLASSMRGEDFNEKARAAQAQDAINEYNTRARQAAINYNAGLPAQEYGMQMQKLGLLGGATSGAATQYGQNAADTRQFWGNLGRAGGGVAKAMTTKDLTDDEKEYIRRWRASSGSGGDFGGGSDTSGYA